MEPLFKNKSGMISRESFLEAQRLLYLNRRKAVRYFYLLGGILLLVGGTVCIARTEYFFAVVFYVIGAFYIYCFKNYYKAASGRAYLRAAKLASPEYEWLFYDKMAVRKAADGEIELDYGRIDDIFETDESVIIYAGGIYWVEKSGFEKGSGSGLIEFLKERTNKIG